jgi:hypothetical protein
MKSTKLEPAETAQCAVVRSDSMYRREGYSSYLISWGAATGCDASLRRTYGEDFVKCGRTECFARDDLETRCSKRINERK